jgi:hypothetical protein
MLTRNPTGARLALLAVFMLALAYPQVRQALRPDFAAKLEIIVQRSDTGEVIPARVYLFKGGRPFQLSPADALLPLRADLFYRERVWRHNSDPKTLEVTARDQSHFILLEGRGEYDLPAAKDYRLEAYHGLFFEPAAAEFALTADQRQQIILKLRPIAPGRQEQWLAADDHIHLMRAREDDSLFLKWLKAEDLAVGNFLELQRQQHAAVQYAFGREGEARSPGFSIRSGHESRSRFYGHTLFLGPRQMIRPLSIGEEYANSPEAYPYPAILFGQGRQAGGMVGFAHFYGSQPNSTLIMNLARNTIDFVELFQFGELRMAPWYELLNAGFRVTGLAGSDLPANVGRADPWPRAIPFLGPERALVKAVPGESAYDAWAAGVKRGAVMLSNGPLLEFSVNGKSSGDVVDWNGESLALEGEASAIFYRPIEHIEFIVNGKVVASKEGSVNELVLSLNGKISESSWVVARAKARKIEGEPDLWAHSNPIYFLKGGKPVYVEADREAVRKRWEREMEYYRSSELKFADESQRRDLIRIGEETAASLGAPQAPWPR